MVNRVSQQHQDALLEGGSVGGLIGMVLGRPLLGALGGVAYKLLTTDGLADAAKKIIGDFMGSDDPLGSLGSILGGRGKAEPKTEAKAESKTEGEGPRRKSGIPTWAKIGLGVVAGTTALNFVQDNLLSTFMGVPNYGMGFPIMPNMWGMDLYSADMYRASMTMNPIAQMMGQFLPWMM